MKMYQEAKRSVTLAALLALGFPWATASADQPPLPVEMQIKVDKAIDNGVNYLNATMNPWGTWAVNKNHMVGHAALPGLTLLECGLPASDPAVQRAAAFVRMSAPRIDATYEIALSILFLDKLDDPKDRPTIQALALRLIAGQTSTGGWSYKCPILYKKEHDQLLTILRNLNVPVLFDPITGTKASAENSSLWMDGLGTGSVQPDFKDPYSPPRSANPDSASESGRQGSLSAEGVSRSGQLSPSASRNWAWCIKMEGSDSETKTPKKLAKIVIPPNLRLLPVLYPPGALPVMDPPGKGQAPMWGTTDNSNTQFAVLALWAAGRQRHQVPTLRTLNLIAKRFYTSQNADGSWGYHHRFGGGEPERPPMTCVGLLGLAVAHGLAHDIDAKVLKGRDPWIVNGLTALSRHVGTPTGRTENLPMANLYFLWSVERVGVLYDLPSIGNKDWYRWGAEILVSNQTQNGNWEKGGYHGANPTTDTCLALLFLKRANLAADLTTKLPFRAGELNTEVAKKQPSAPASKENPAKANNAAKVGPEAGPALFGTTKPEETEKDFSTGLSTTTPPVVRNSSPAAQPEEPKSGYGFYWFLGILLLLVILIGIALALFARESEDDEERSKSGRRAKKKARR
jgi:hypothetical protein